MIEWAPILLSVFQSGMQTFHGGADGRAVLWLSYGSPTCSKFGVVFGANSRKVVIDVQPWQLAFDTEMKRGGEIFRVV